jgi:hypothetical protein
VALLGLFGWGANTLALGVMSTVGGIREVTYVTSPHDPWADPEPILYSDSWMQTGLLLLILWMFTSLGIIIAAGLGIAHIALAHDWRRRTAFAVVTFGAPAAAVAFLAQEPTFGQTSYRDAVAPGLAMSVIAVLAMTTGWWLLDLRRPVVRPS